MKCATCKSKLIQDVVNVYPNELGNPEEEMRLVCPNGCEDKPRCPSCGSTDLREGSYPNGPDDADDAYSCNKCSYNGIAEDFYYDNDDMPEMVAKLAEEQKDLIYHAEV